MTVTARLLPAAAIAVLFWAAASKTPSEAELTAGLARFGYGYLDEDPAAVIAAFQRHFRPVSVTGTADGGTGAVLEALLRLVDAGKTST